MICNSLSGKLKGIFHISGPGMRKNKEHNSKWMGVTLKLVCGVKVWEKASGTMLEICCILISMRRNKRWFGRLGDPQCVCVINHLFVNRFLIVFITDIS